MKSIVPREKTKHTRSRTKRRTLILVGILVLVVVAGGAYYWLVIHKTTSPEVQKTTESTSKGIVIKSPDAYRSELGEAETTNDKVALYRELITSQQINLDFTGAVASTQELLLIEKSASNYALLGALYKATGQTAQAIESYKSALELTPVSTDPDARSDYNAYKEALTSLQGGS